MPVMWRPKGSQFFDSNGDPLTGGEFTYFDAGTTTPKSVYRDSDGTVPWGQPIVLDADGRLEDSIYVGPGNFKEILEDGNGVTVFTDDNIPGETVINIGEFTKPILPVISKAVSYQVTTADLGSYIQADATGGDVTITLPAVSSSDNGAVVGVQNVGSAGRVIVAASTGDTVNGVPNIQILKPNSGGLFVSSAGSWKGPITDQPFTTQTRNSAFTVNPADFGRTIKCDATSASFTATLPAAATVRDGFEVTIKKMDSSTNRVTIDGNGAETIDGAATLAIYDQWQAVTVRCDGANWQVVSGASPQSLAPPGAVMPYAGATAPGGWLLCFGQAISRTAYAGLFAAISTTYGAGDGSTTFNVPDLRGRVPAGQDDMGGTSANRLTGRPGGVDGDILGAAGGEEAHLLTTAELPAHTHRMFANAQTGTLLLNNADSQVAQNGNFGSNDANNYQAASSAAAATLGQSGATGGATAHNVVQPTLILNYIIKI